MSDKQQAESSNSHKRAEDANSHGGWWIINSEKHITGQVAIEFAPHCFIRALDNGLMVLGAPHVAGEGPADEEILTAIRATTNQVSFKSGYGKYLSIDSHQRLIGRSEAIGEQESFLPVLQDDKMALCAYNDCFLSANDEIEGIPIEAKSKRAEANHMLKIRTNFDPASLEAQQRAKELPVEERGNIYETELGYLKKFQSHGEKDFNLKDSKRELKRARVTGELHEALLDKRSKHRSDKYCK